MKHFMKISGVFLFLVFLMGANTAQADVVYQHAFRSIVSDNLRSYSSDLYDGAGVFDSDVGALMFFEAVTSSDFISGFYLTDAVQTSTISFDDGLFVSASGTATAFGSAVYEPFYEPFYENPDHVCQDDSCYDPNAMSSLFVQFEVTQKSVFLYDPDDLFAATIEFYRNGNSSDNLLTDMVQPESGIIDPGIYTFEILAETRQTGCEFYDITFKVNDVPLPSAVWLLGSGLMGLMGWRRKSGPFEKY